ncbi:MAG: hypothetical protein ACRDPJ_13885 [Nocardioidaceae bacterium]
MMRSVHSGVALAASSAVLVTSAAGAVHAGVRAPSDPGVCSGVSGCVVKARTDVNGDGTPDTIGIARRGKDGAAQGAVIIRVKTGPGTIVSVRRKTEWWLGPLWQGTAALDGRRGREIVVGEISGAHAQYFRAVTWRHGQLVDLDAPGRERFWGIDGAVWISAGWQHRAGDPEGTIRKRVAIRTGNATVSPFKGRITTYRWTRDGWGRVGTRTIYPLPDEVAWRWGGFHVPGLARW